MLNNPIMEQLKAKTQIYHAELETLPFAQALLNETLPLASYVGQLRVLAIIHAVLERELNQLNHHSIISPIWQSRHSRSAHLKADLAYWATHQVGDIAESIKQTFEITKKMRLYRVQTPLSLLGYLYVLEGATQGGAMLQPYLKRLFKLETTAGLAYYNSYGDAVVEQWHHFGKLMNQMVITIDAQTAVIEGAQTFYQDIIVLHKMLYPLPTKLSPLKVTSLNPEAGDHPIPTDPQEIIAALEAREQCWQEFPYYQWRYGERGQRFADSDGAWLVTLTHLEQSQLQQQINWLTRLLAQRGMPHITMQRHLEILYHKLVTLIPEKEATYHKLWVAAQHLANDRRQYFSDQQFDLLSQTFQDKVVNTAWATRLPNAGLLIVSAVVDEQNGLTHAVTSLLDWLTEAERFPTEWIQAVHDTVEATRQHVNQAPKGFKNP